MKMFTPRIVALAAIGFALALAAPAAESLSLLLQKAIYAEETEGNLDSAIKLYEQIAAESAANRSIAAEAQYRLAVCYQKLGRKEQAVKLLNALLQRSSADPAWTQKTRTQLAALGQSQTAEITMRKVIDIGWVMSVSTDGRYIIHRPSSGTDLTVLDSQTGKSWVAVAGTRDRYVENGAILSNDARQIAYDLSGRGLYVANIDGTGAKQIYSGRDYSLWPIGWKRDGRTLIVAFTRAEHAGIALIDRETGIIREIQSRIRPSSFGYERKRLSANNRYLAYTERLAAGGRRILVLDIESGSETAIVEREVTSLVGWSPDSRNVLFLSDRTGVRGLWEIPFENGKPTGDPRSLRSNLGDVASVDVTSDGRFFFYSEANSTDTVHVMSADLTTGKILEPPRRVSERFPGVQSLPLWSKDGGRLMFAVQKGQQRFVVVSAPSEEEVDYPVRDVFAKAPIQKTTWSADGGFVLVQSVFAALNKSGIHRFNLATGTAEALVLSEEGKTWNANPRLSPDGTAFYYAHRAFHGSKQWTDTIIRRDLQSGSEKTVYAPSAKLQIWEPFALSPDGNKLAIIHSDQFLNDAFTVSVQVLDIQSGRQHELLQTGARENVYSAAWTPDGKRLLIAKRRVGMKGVIAGKLEVWSLDATSGAGVQLPISMPGMRNFDVHPDGRRIAFQTGAPGLRELWVMEGLFPPSAQPSGQ